ncbi:MAG: phosphoglucosamine mutase [Phormidesmis sp.]
MQSMLRAGLLKTTGHLALPTQKLFGTDGIRGKAGTFLTGDIAFQIGYWTGQILKSQASQLGPVILGQDSRNSGKTLVSALTLGLTKAGMDVWQLGLCPTPAVAYLVNDSAAVGGIMVSASHNPPEDNGIKIFGANGIKLPAVLQDQIEAGIRGQQRRLDTAPATSGTSVTRCDLLDLYLSSLLAPLANVGLQGMKVVLDLAWGAAVYTAPTVFQTLGAEVICLHALPDGDRINVNCGSTHLEPLSQAVQRHRADIGFAFDGDADRVIAVDGQGRCVDGDYILYLWGQHLQDRAQLPGHTLVSTVMANLGFERAWEQMGGRLIRTPVGDQHVQTAMTQQSVMLGGEQSGHVLCSHFGVSGDGVLTALHLAALVKEGGRSLSELRDQSFQPYPQLLKNICVEDASRRLQWQDCEALQAAIANATAAMGNQGRVLVRASGTEPILRIMVEAELAEWANHWSEELSRIAYQHLVEPFSLLTCA